jgi:hypothetical protein
VFDTNTFNIRERLRIGAISIQSSCPLDPEKCRKASEFYLDNLGTEVDYWSLAQRQLLFQCALGRPASAVGRISVSHKSKSGRDTTASLSISATTSALPTASFTNCADFPTLFQALDDIKKHQEGIYAALNTLQNM